MEVMSIPIAGIGFLSRHWEHVWPGRLMARTSLREAMIGPCRCGTQLMEVISIPIVAILMQYGLWPGRLMAHASLREALIRPCRCGTQNDGDGDLARPTCYGKVCIKNKLIHKESFFMRAMRA